MARPWFNVRPPGSAAALSNFDVNAMPILQAAPSGPGGLGNFTFTAGDNPFTTGGGYDDGTQFGTYGTLDSGGGTGGAVLNSFCDNNSSGLHSKHLYLLVTGNGAPLAQTAFNTISFVDASGNAVQLTPTSAVYTNWVFANLTFSQSGNLSAWDWLFVPIGALANSFTAGNPYAVTVT